MAATSESKAPVAVPVGSKPRIVKFEGCRVEDLCRGQNTYKELYVEAAKFLGVENGQFDLIFTGKCLPNNSLKLQCPEDMFARIYPTREAAVLASKVKKTEVAAEANKKANSELLTLKECCFLLKLETFLKAVDGNPEETRKFLAECEVCVPQFSLDVHRIMWSGLALLTD